MRVWDWMVSVFCLLAIATLVACGDPRDEGAVDDDGGDGATTPPPGSPELLTRRDAEPPGENCPAGGIALHAGRDEDGDGMLDDDEIERTEYVCDEPTGQVVREEDLPPGELCPEGGTVIHIGLDDDGDGVLDDDEIDSSSYVCDESEIWLGDVTDDDWLDPETRAAIERARVIEGSLVIPVAGAVELPVLELVTGDLAVRGDMTALELPSLRTVGGHTVIDTPGVDSLELAALERIGGQLFITGNGVNGESVSAPLLREIGGRLVLWWGVRGAVSMPSLRAVGGALSIEGSITSLSLDALESVSGDLIYDDLVLERIRLEALEFLAGDIQVGLEDSLVALELPSLAVLGGELYLSDLERFNTLSLPGLTEIQGQLVLIDLPVLDTLDVGALRVVAGQINIREAPLLASVPLDSLVSLGVDGGLSDIGLSLSVRDTGISALELPALVGVDGDIMLLGNADLRSVRMPLLADVRELILDRSLALEELSAPALESADEINVRAPRLTALALDSLVSVDTAVALADAAIADLSGLPALRSAPLLRFENLDQLEDLGGLAELRTARSLVVRANQQLRSLRGANRLTQLSGGLQIVGNPSLETLTDLSELTHVGGFLDVDTNRSLRDVGMTSLLSIGGGLQIRACDVLESLDGLTALTTVGSPILSLQDLPLISEEEIQAFLERLGF